MNIDDINYELKGNKVNSLLMEVFGRTGRKNEMEKTECSSNSGHGGYITLEKESHVWGNGGTSSLCPGDHYQQFTRHRVNETSPQIEEQSGHYRQVTVTTQRSIVNDTSRTEEESSLNIKITSAFSLNPKMSSSSFHGKELLFSSNHPQLTRIEFEPGGSKLSSRFSPSSVLQQQHAQIKSEVPKDHQLKASLTIQGNVNEDTNNSSLSNEKRNNNNSRQQGYTKLRKSREIESENRNEWNNSVANKNDMQPLKNVPYTGLADQCYISNDNGGPSISQQLDRKRKIQEPLMTPRKVEFTTKSNRLDQRGTVSIYSSEELGNGCCRSDDSLRRYQQDNCGPKSLSFTTIKRTKRAKECDKSIASDMITHGMPSLLSTASGEHHLPMVVTSHTNDNTKIKFKGSAQRHLVNYAAKVPLPCRLQNMSPDPFRKFKMTKEAQIQQSNVHPSIFSGSTHPYNAAVHGKTPLPLNDKGRVEMKKPINFKSLNSKRKVPNVQLLITPAPETFKNLEMRLGLENDEEPVVKIPNYFLDFIPEYRPNDPSTPKLVDVSQATRAENSQALVTKAQPQFPCHKANSKLVDNVVKVDMYAKQTRLENKRKKLTEETKVLRVFKPSKKSAVSFLEKSSDVRHFAFSLYNDDQGPTSAPTTQVFAGVSRPPVEAIPPVGYNSVLARPDEYQEKVSHVPLKMTADSRSSNQACTSFESISELGSLLPQSNQANCKCAKSHVVVFNGINTQSPRCFSEGSNRKITQERKNCIAFERKDRVASTEDEYYLGSSPKHRTSNERETSIPKDMNILSELDSSKPTDTRTAEKFFFHSSGHGLLNVSPDYEIISTCTQTSSVVENATAVSLGKRKHQCEVCGRAFSRSNTLITHNRIHTGDRPFPCDECGRAFRQLGNLTRHKLTHAAVKPHACPICKKCFSRTSNLNTHIRTHTNYKPFVCEFCGKGFHQKVDMKIHRYTHTGEKPHKCSKCGRGFKQLTHLKYHMRTHSAVRLYKCEHCGKGFNQKGNLQAHIYGHTGNRPYRCDICGKGFTLTSTLNTHKRTHAPLKPFKCEFCEKAFYQKNALKTHYISSHPYTDGVCLL